MTFSKKGEQTPFSPILKSGLSTGTVVPKPKYFSNTTYINPAILSPNFPWYGI